MDDDKNAFEGGILGERVPIMLDVKMLAKVARLVSCQWFLLFDMSLRGKGGLVRGNQIGGARGRRCGH
jgi:hypothetical protein